MPFFLESDPIELDWIERDDGCVGVENCRSSFITTISITTNPPTYHQLDVDEDQRKYNMRFRQIYSKIKNTFYNLGKYILQCGQMCFITTHIHHHQPTHLRSAG